MKENNRLTTKNSRVLLKAILTAGMLFALPLQANADEHTSWQDDEQSNWYMSSSVTGVTGTYSGSSLRDQFYSAGFIVTGEYLEQHGITFGYTNSNIKFKGDADSTSQNEFFLGGHKSFNTDGMNGTFDVRLNGHYISNNDSSGDTDGVKVVAPLISYLNYKKSFYFDVGYAYSAYQNDLDVTQISPAIGLGFSKDSNWIQLRGYFISSSNATRSQGKSSTAAGLLKFTHWFAPDNALQLHNASIGGMLGERLYAVDVDNLSVYNLADVQKGSVAADLSWKIDNSISILLHASYNLYENLTISEKYNSSAAALSLSKEW
ncbi:MAG: hypothetical protein HQL69_08660 [Magnetococcales bacterium]|nr:hypothetical protein [Magnetococcales bacterium]